MRARRGLAARCQEVSQKAGPGTPGVSRGPQREGVCAGLASPLLPPTPTHVCLCLLCALEVDVTWGQLLDSAAVWRVVDSASGEGGRPGQPCRLHPCRPACTPALAALLQTALPAGGSSCSRSHLVRSHWSFPCAPQAPRERPAGPGALPPVGSLMALMGAGSNSPPTGPPALLGFL